MYDRVWADATARNFVNLCARAQIIDGEFRRAQTDYRFEDCWTLAESLSVMLQLSQDFPEALSDYNYTKYWIKKDSISPIMDTIAISKLLRYRFSPAGLADYEILERIDPDNHGFY